MHWLPLLASLALSGAAFLPGGLPGRSAVSPQASRVNAVTMNADYYARLGVQRNADEKAIKNVRSPRTHVVALPCGVSLAAFQLAHALHALLLTC